MYPYHNKIKQRIKNGELVGYVFVDDYKDIGECLLLQFNTPPFERPIRPHKYHEYVDILAEWKRNKESRRIKSMNTGSFWFGKEYKCSTCGKNSGYLIHHNGLIRKLLRLKCFAHIPVTELSKSGRKQNGKRNGRNKIALQQAKKKYNKRCAARFSA